jgi:hypothetical protein
MVTSIPRALKAVWKVKKDPFSDFEVVDTTDPMYKGTTAALPRPKLVWNGYRTEQLEFFQLEVLNFVGSSSKSTQGMSKGMFFSVLRPHAGMVLASFNRKQCHFLITTI